tara:strand:- start:22 stop:1065 length:1044 start_codon:yes stop_codon:yes gene_type:complete
MSTNQKNNEEEVDLGSLFVIIGKGFSNFFNFIGNIFKGIFHYFISILIFLKENFVLIGSGALVGLVAGFILELNSTDTFESSMLVAPNFKSAQQLYNNVNYYNDLVKQKDTARIQKTFNLDKETAASLKKFSIKPIVNENDIINAYNDFVLEVDTATVSSYTFNTFKATFTGLDYKVHEIHVISEKNNVFNKLSDAILSSVVENKYFNRVKKLSNENLDRIDVMYRENLLQIDSLRRVYMQVMLAESKKESTGTNIDLGSEKNTTKELELFDTNRKINKDIQKITVDKSQNYEVINLLSNFQPIGSEINGVIQNKAAQLAALGAVLMILLLSLIKINKYLVHFKKQK